MASNVPSVYLHVIEDVVSKIRDEFVASGVGEGVLSELQAIWEAKMIQCGVISPNMERPSLQKQTGPITPVHDLNVPAVEEYETPTAEMLFPPTPLQTPAPQTPIQTPLPGTDHLYNIPTGSSDYASVGEVRNGDDMKAGRPSPYMQPPSPWITQRPLGVDVNVAYVEGREEVDRGAPYQPTTQEMVLNFWFSFIGFFHDVQWETQKRDDYATNLTPGAFMPQQDGNWDMEIEFSQSKEAYLSSTVPYGRIASGLQCSDERGTNVVLPQQDGVHDEYDLFHFQSVTTEDYNTPTPAEHVDLRAPTPLAGTPKPTKSEGLEDDEPPLNEDDDDDDDLDGFGQGGEEPSTQHLVLAQFDKVTRTKNRWKCTLKDGIMHINSRDILFNKATGEFEF
ncbi:hypothetical protein HPP92_017425 [Vanilla planifolia]|uniref:Uncharacterized protein n=1 Tax=Vanilla planifolia TaxID=51239 RepID=A0A835UNF1_VANPL|nr:hypothetical protein HPP92_017425 [Vanilla planifolia]